MAPLSFILYTQLCSSVHKRWPGHPTWFSFPAPQEELERSLRNCPAVPRAAVQSQEQGRLQNITAVYLEPLKPNSSHSGFSRGAGGISGKKARLASAAKWKQSSGVSSGGNTSPSLALERKRLKQNERPICVQLNASTGNCFSFPC